MYLVFSRALGSYCSLNLHIPSMTCHYQFPAKNLKICVAPSELDDTLTSPLPPPPRPHTATRVQSRRRTDRTKCVPSNRIAIARESRRTRAAFVSNHAEDRSVVRSIDLSIAIANRFVLDAMREPRERKPPAKVRVEGVCCMRGAVGAVMGAGGWWCANACDAMVIRIDVD